MLRVSSFVDDKMEAVAKTSENLSTSMIAVLTSINIADQYLKIKTDFDNVKSEMKQFQSKTVELEKHVETLRKELDERNKAYAELEKKTKEIQADRQGDEQVNLLKKELLEKEDDLEKAQVLINDLHNKLFANQIKLVEATNELDECMGKRDS